jgi:hypothetical protein
MAERALIAVFGLLPKRNFPLKVAFWSVAQALARLKMGFSSRYTPFTEFVLSAKNCLTFALSARICFFSTAVTELECFCLPASVV